MDISEQAQGIIKDFLGEWWESLTWQAGQTVLDAQLPICTVEQLYEQPFGQTLREIAAAAEGLRADDRRGETQDAVQNLAEWMFARPGGVYHIPDEWWATPMGGIALRAHVWARGDELITLTQAAEIAGLGVKRLSAMLERGKLSRFRDTQEPNPRRATRVLRSEVERLRDE